MNEPLVIDPPNFDAKASWNECRQYVEKCGGLTHEDGEVNWRAAFGADPGVCSCPVCDEFYWAWGRKQRCTECGFEYDTDWWCMYSWGGQAASAKNQELFLRSGSHARHMEQSKYYRWAFEHGATPTMEAAKVVAWRTVFPEDATNCKVVHK